MIVVENSRLFRDTFLAWSSVTLKGQAFQGREIVIVQYSDKYRREHVESSDRLTAQISIILKSD